MISGDGTVPRLAPNGDLVPILVHPGLADDIVNHYGPMGHAQRPVGATVDPSHVIPNSGSFSFEHPSKPGKLHVVTAGDTIPQGATNVQFHPRGPVAAPRTGGGEGPRGGGGANAGPGISGPLSGGSGGEGRVGGGGFSGGGGGASSGSSSGSGAGGSGSVEGGGGFGGGGSAGGTSGGTSDSGSGGIEPDLPESEGPTVELNPSDSFGPSVEINAGDNVGEPSVETNRDLPVDTADPNDPLNWSPEDENEGGGVGWPTKDQE